ncbi:DUF4097 domain-containing protein [Streptomyces sp. NPDC060209]|uniref:DUF4097 family beta strand repeat-containing protein n=1 Tax=Streptomyces sp. NPDC060209 TaxID=3347073 RepID=UPI0036465909
MDPTTHVDGTRHEPVTTAFETPEPIALVLGLGAGAVCVRASDRTDTHVRISPGDPAAAADVRAAELAEITFADGTLSIGAARTRRSDLSAGSLAVLVELPAGSTLHGHAGSADLDAAGRLGKCRFTTTRGDIRLDEVGPVHLRTVSGDLFLGRVTGSAEIMTGRGRVRVTEVLGAARVSNAHGDTRLGRITGALKVAAADGDVVVDLAYAAVDIRTSTGNVRLNKAACGPVVLRTASGDLETAVPQDARASLDLRTDSGRVTNILRSAEVRAFTRPDVRIRARAGSGNVLVRNAGPRSAR